MMNLSAQTAHTIKFVTWQHPAMGRMARFTAPATINENLYSPEMVAIKIKINKKETKT